MKNNRIFATLVSFVILSSCTRVYYAPTTQNVPLLTEKNELRVVAGESVGEEYGALDLPVAYSPVKHFGIMANTFWAARDLNYAFKTSSPNTGHFTELGIGVYYPIKNYLTVESFVGFGLGTISYPGNFDIIAPIHFKRSFLQYAIGYKRTHFEVAFSNRISFLKYTNTDYMNIGFSNFPYSSIPTENLYIFFEPSLTLRTGGENIKGQMQCQFSHSLKDTYLSRSRFNINVGVIITPSGFFKKSPDK